MGLFNWFNKTVNILDKASTTRERWQEAEALAKEKKLREAVKIAEEISQQWSNNSSWGELLLREVSISDILKQVDFSLTTWKETVKRVENLTATAKNLEAKDTNNPLETRILKEIMQLYQQAKNLLYDVEFVKEIARFERKIYLREQFQGFYIQGKSNAAKGFYKEALVSLLQAKNLFSVQELDTAIAVCQSKVPLQEKYEISLIQTKELAKAGKFSRALPLLQSALNEFKRADGQNLLVKLQTIELGNQAYKAGVAAEKAGMYSLANTKYEDAIKYVPILYEAKIRQAIIAIKHHQYDLALNKLEGIEGHLAVYLRGFASAKQQAYQQADRQWQSIPHPKVIAQREILKTLVERDRLNAIQTLETLVKQENLEEAKTASEFFVAKFGLHSTVTENLDKHILPRIEKKLWENKDFSSVAALAEKNWLARLNISSLHNWAIAAYYRAVEDSQFLPEAIIAWSTALANIALNPCLEDISSIRGVEINLSDLSSKLTDLVENLIEKVKETDLETYLQLRDRYRLELVVLRDSNHQIIRVKDLLILPGCYQKHINNFGVSLPATVGGALYSQWGETIAACLEGDISRALLLKPKETGNLEVEKFALNWVSYHEGIYYLQQKQWRKAMP